MMGDTISTANVRVWFDQFLTAKQAAGLAPTTLKWYRERIGVYLAWIDAHDGLRPLDAIALENFLAQQRRINSKATVQSHYRTLSTFCNWLIKRRYITANESPVNLVDKPQLPSKRMKYVTKAEFDRLYASVRGDKWTAHRDRLMLTILYYSGLRANELLHLRVADIERTEGVIVVRAGKGDKDRVVPYAPEVPALLDAYLNARPTSQWDSALFVSNDGIGGVRGAMEYDGLKMVWRRRCKLAGLPPLRLHSFRHGFAMWALNNGVPMSALSAMMGHSSVVVTESTYARWVTSAIKREYTMAFERLESE